MKRLSEDEIVLTQAELNSMIDFINSSLARDWDRYTDHYICTDSWADGMRRMNPEMYDMAEKMVSV